MIKSLIVAGLMILGFASTAFAAANPFVDVPSGHWAYNAVTSLAAKGINEGYGDSTFRGDRNITRYEAASLLAKVITKINNVSVTGNGKTFSDVPKSHWAYKSVSILSATGITKGYGDGTFRGDKNITRYEMSLMIANLIEKNLNVTAEGENPFSDVPSGHWAGGAVTILAERGINEGYGNGTFMGNRNITRYETAMMLSRALATK